jgi:phosphoglycolate phosphatase-like HAD superfamily hydrolase
MSTFSDKNYRKFLLPKRLVFFDLDGTIIPSTSATGRRIAIALSTYKTIREFARSSFNIDSLPDVSDEEQCSTWYREYGGAHGLIKQILSETTLAENVIDCLSFYFTGLFNRRLTQYHEVDLQYDWVPDAHLKFLHTLAEQASIMLISYRYQTQFDFLTSLETLGLTKGGLFGPNNAFAVGGPGTSSDGSKSRFVGSMWRNEIRAHGALISDIGKTFPPIVVGDSVRDIHFTVDIGGIFFGVSEAGEDSQEILLSEIKDQEDNLNTRSRIFPSLADEQLQRRLLEECEAYRETIKKLNS